MYKTLYLIRSTLMETMKLYKNAAQFIKSCIQDPWMEYDVIFFAFFFTYTWTLILTILPVFLVLSGPSIDYYSSSKPNWYSFNDIMRICEPIGGLALNFWIISLSGIFAGLLVYSTRCVLYITT